MPSEPEVVVLQHMLRRTAAPGWNSESAHAAPYPVPLPAAERFPAAPNVPGAPMPLGPARKGGSGMVVLESRQAS